MRQLALGPDVGESLVYNRLQVVRHSRVAKLSSADAEVLRLRLPRFLRQWCYCRLFFQFSCAITLASRAG